MPSELIRLYLDLVHDLVYLWLLVHVPHGVTFRQIDLVLGHAAALLPFVLEPIPSLILLLDLFVLSIKNVEEVTGAFDLVEVLHDRLAAEIGWEDRGLAEDIQGLGLDGLLGGAGLLRSGLVCLGLGRGLT